jgi:alpha-beta hydrolase superfamily lysophospholipase
MVMFSPDVENRLMLSPPRLQPALSRRFPLGPMVACVMLSALAGLPSRGASAAEQAAAAAAAGEELALQTSDGLRIAAWYYRVAGDAKPQAVVMLVHDIEGSHKTVEPLARVLQRAGYAVVAPDLRAHGASQGRAAAATRAEDVEPRMLKKADLEAIAAATGGRLRDQSAFRGELEAVRNWIKERSEAGELDIDRLCVVGCGLGGTLATLWTAADWNWPPTTTGPQGRQVRALALVSPVWANKGVSLSVPLASEAIRQQVPIMVIAGKADRDGARLFDQLKRFRPDAWFAVRPGKPPEKAPSLADAADGTAFFSQIDTSLTADKLASDPAAHVGDQLKTFFQFALARPRE